MGEGSEAKTAATNATNLVFVMKIGRASLRLIGAFHDRLLKSVFAFIEESFSGGRLRFEGWGLGNLRPEAAGLK